MRRWPLLLCCLCYCAAFTTDELHAFRDVISASPKLFVDVFCDYKSDDGRTWHDMPYEEFTGTMFMNALVEEAKNRKIDVDDLLSSVEPDQLLDYFRQGIEKSPTPDHAEPLDDKEKESPMEENASKHDKFKLLLFVRHGESINNILSTSKDPMRYLSEGWAIFARGLSKPNAFSANEDILWSLKADATRDTVLSQTGEARSDQVAQQLHSLRRELGLLADVKSKDGVLVAKHRIFRPTALYTSPLRRTQATSMRVFGKAAVARRMPFKLAAWAHEAYNSRSDLGYDLNTLKTYTVQYALDRGLDVCSVPIRSLFNDFQRLLEASTNEWSTSTAIPLDDVPRRLFTRPNLHIPYFYNDNDVQTNEPHDFLCARVAVLENWLTEIPERDAIVVTHSNLMKALFDKFSQGRKVDNIAAILAELDFNSTPKWRHVAFLQSPLLSKPQSLSMPTTTALRNLPTWEESHSHKKPLTPSNICVHHFFALTQPPAYARYESTDVAAVVTSRDYDNQDQHLMLFRMPHDQKKLISLLDEFENGKNWVDMLRPSALIKMVSLKKFSLATKPFERLDDSWIDVSGGSMAMSRIIVNSQHEDLVPEKSENIGEVQLVLPTETITLENPTTLPFPTVFVHALQIAAASSD